VWQLLACCQVIIAFKVIRGFAIGPVNGVWARKGAAVHSHSTNPVVAECNNLVDAAWLLACCFMAQVGAQLAQELVHKGSIFAPSCPFYSRQEAVCKGLGGLSWSLVAGEKASNCTFTGFSEPGDELGLELRPAAEPVEARPALSSACHTYLGNA
jgi:hypothetical protein